MENLTKLGPMKMLESITGRKPETLCVRNLPQRTVGIERGEVGILENNM